MLRASPYGYGIDDDAYWNEVNANEWWAVRKQMDFDSQLVDIATDLVGACASSASLERHFSTLGYTYGSLRNRLGVERAGKLTFLFKVFRSKW